MSQQIELKVEASKLQTESNDQYLTFHLAGEAYGVAILKVQEIKGWEPVRQIPNTPRFIKGVLNLRGTIVPVIDLRERFGMDRVVYTPVTVVVVLTVQSGGSDHIMGIVADGVSDVLDVKSDEIKKAPNFGAKIDTRYIKGMVVGQEMIMLLDADKLLDPDDYALIDGLQ